MLLLSTLALTLIIVPGEFKFLGHQEMPTTAWEKRCGKLSRSTQEWHTDYNRKANLSNHIQVMVFEHGWPKPFLARARVLKETESGQNWVRSEPLLGMKSWFTYWGGSTYLNVSWSNFDAWPFAADNIIFDLWSFIIDLLVAGCLLVSIAALTQFWIASHQGRFHVHLSDLLGLITLVALALGVYLYHHQIRVAEGLATNPLQPPGFALHGGDMAASQAYCGPAWLRKLCGNEYYPQLFHHVTNVAIVNNSHWKERCEELPRYPYLESLHVRTPLPLEAIEYLKSCRQLKDLHLPAMSNRRGYPPHTPNDISADNLQLLSSLHLESIELNGDQIQASHIEQVAAFPTIRLIKVTRASATEEQIEAIRTAYPHVEIVIGIDLEDFLSPE
jgi:hypothetical protein